MSAPGGLLGWVGCPNARDVGGLPTRDGRRVRSGALLRTDSLDQLDVTGIRCVQDLRPALVLDLRSDFETAVKEHPLGADRAYRCIPFIDPARDVERDRAAEHTLADRYRGSLDRNGGQVAAIVRATAAAPDGPVIVHCVAGKDRTGLVVALLLDLVGVPHDLICADYARSEELLQLTDADKFSRSRPETMAETLRHLDQRWGGAGGYLAAHGVDEATLEQVRSRLLDR